MGDCLTTCPLQDTLGGEILFTLFYCVITQQSSLCCELEPPCLRLQNTRHTLIWEGLGLIQENQMYKQYHYLGNTD